MFVPLFYPSASQLHREKDSALVELEGAPREEGELRIRVAEGEKGDCEKRSGRNVTSAIAFNRVESTERKIHVPPSVHYKCFVKI